MMAKKTVKQVMIRVPEDLYAQFIVLAERRYRTITGELRHVLEEVLAAEGLWPPPEGDGADKPKRKGGKW
jgi:hypothetical protein